MERPALLCSSSVTMRRPSTRPWSDMTDRSPAPGAYPVPGPGGTVMREWDGAAWTNSFSCDAPDRLSPYQRQPWRWLAFPGWLLAVGYVLGLVGAGVLAGFATASIPARIGLALSVAAATSTAALALLVLLDRRIAFGQLHRARAAIITWGIGAGLACTTVAILIVYAVSGEWNAPLVSAAHVPGWLVGLLHGPLKLLVPIALWASGRFRVPRQGFLLVLVTGMTCAVTEATADAWFTAAIDKGRTGAVILTVLLSAIVAAVPWRAAWRRKEFFVGATVAALIVAFSLHWLADTLIVHRLDLAALAVVIAGYFVVKVVARQLVPPDHVALVSAGWRPWIGTLLSPDTPLLTRRGLEQWLASSGRRGLSATTVAVVRGMSRATTSLWRAAIAILGVVAIAACAGIVAVLGLTIRDVVVQRSLDSFYRAEPGDLGEPGTLLRTEPMTADSEPVSVPGGKAFRMLYTSALPDGTPVPASGMLIVPNSPAPPGKRPVLAWAHPTLGEGSGCAPSRSSNPLLDMQPWLTLALQRGWVVVATDYAGVGTVGTPLYLVGESEARDVLYAVRAARDLPDADASTQVAVFGHSQGGHSALWTGLLADDITPDLTLVGVAAAAPAANLTPVFNALWDGSQTWLLSPDVITSWTTFYPWLTDRVLTPFARAFGPRAARECITAAAVQAQLLSSLGLPFTVKDPLRHPGWAAAARAQTPPPFRADLPLLLIQSTTDKTIPPLSNADLQTTWCAAGSRINAVWLAGVSHVDTATTASPMVIDWIGHRFAGNPPIDTCTPPPPPNTPPPVPVL